MTPFRTSLAADTMNMLVTSRINIGRVNVQKWDYRDEDAKGNLGEDPEENPEEQQAAPPTRKSTVAATTVARASSSATILLRRGTTGFTDDMEYVESEEEDFPDADFEEMD